MARVSSTRGYKGRGRFTLNPLAGGRPFEVGNVVTLSETIESERNARANNQDVGGGELDVDEFISSVTFELIANDITPQNIALGLRGSFEELATGAITEEAHEIWSGLRIAFKYLPDPTVAATAAIVATQTHATEKAIAKGDVIIESTRAYIATVAGTTAASAPTFPTDLTTVVDGTVTWKDCGPATLTADTDFTATPHGLLMMPAADGRFADDLGLPIEVGYTRNPQWLIQALVNSGEEYEMIYHGLNAVDSGNPMVGRYFRVKFSPTSGFNRHGGDDFAELTLTGTVLEDSTRVGAGLSKYMEFSMI